MAGIAEVFLHAVMLSLIRSCHNGMTAVVRVMAPLVILILETRV